ncbi:MAG TPA: glycosyltransferase family 9 protein [Ignavibacteriaceae bacterium]|nr:glycosyltransferase family 9 protein [Ignavibacteriaceae bacterium]
MSVQRILVIQTAFIGDAILTLPMIQFLSNKFNNCSVDVLAIPSTAELFYSSPFVNKVFVIDKKNEHKSFWSVIKIAKIISTNNYTKIYSPHRSFRTALIVLFSKVKETIGFSNSSFTHVYENVIEYRYDFHEVRRNLELAGNKTNDTDWKILPIITPKDEVRKKVEEVLSIKKINNFVAIAPGSIWATKRYPEEYFKKIIDYLINLNETVLLLGSQEDFNMCNSISNNSDKVINMAGELSLIESIELLKKAKLLICNDSAPTHLGMCADIPVLTIYCSTVPDFGFYPYNNKSQSIGINNLSCKPCGIHGHPICPLGHFNCGNNLLPENILPIINKILTNES